MRWVTDTVNVPMFSVPLEVHYQKVWICFLSWDGGTCDGSLTLSVLNCSSGKGNEDKIRKGYTYQISLEHIARSEIEKGKIMKTGPAHLFWICGSTLRLNP